MLIILLRGGVGVDLPAQFVQTRHVELLLRDVDVHARTLGKQFVRFGVVNARPSLGNFPFAFSNLADNSQQFSNGNIFAILYFELAREHETRIIRIAAHVRPPADFIDKRGDDAAMQNTGVPLKVIGCNVLRFDNPGPGFINMQMQPCGVFQSANKAMTRVRLFYFLHDDDYTLDMSQPKIFITRLIPDLGLNLVKEHFPSPDIWTHDLPPTREQLLEKARGVDGLLCLLTERVDTELMDAAGPQLKAISSMSVGVDHIDVAEATKRGIPVGNTPGVLTDATADQAFALLLAAARRVVEGVDYIRSGQWTTWHPQLLLGADLVGATLGIVGFGRIGQAVARRAQGFDMRIIFYDLTAEPAYGAQFVDLDTLLRESDFVSLHVPLTHETKHLVNADFLSKMKPDAILVNTTRGGVVDQTALYNVLKSKQIFAAALDVTDPEPLPMNSPLLELDNCIIVPHLGSASKWTRGQMSRLAAENLIAGLKGERLPNSANPEVYG